MDSTLHLHSYIHTHIPPPPKYEGKPVYPSDFEKIWFAGTTHFLATGYLVIHPPIHSARGGKEREGERIDKRGIRRNRLKDEGGEERWKESREMNTRGTPNCKNHRKKIKPAQLSVFKKILVVQPVEAYNVRKTHPAYP